MPKSPRNLSPDLLLQLQQQRDGIEADVDAAIEDFLKNANKHTANKIIKAVKAYGDTTAGFAAWQDFTRNEDYVALRNSIQDRKISMRKAYAVSSDMIKTMQHQDGKKTYMPHTALRRGLMSAFNLVAGPMMAGSNRGGLDFRQESVFESFVVVHIMYGEPGASLEPLTAVLAPHIKKAVMEKLTTSYSDLKKQAGKPLVDEDIVRGLRDEILTESYARFDKLAEQLRKPEASPMPSYGFSPQQMPEDVTFGVEFEGFIPDGAKFPKNLMTLSENFNENSLPTTTALLPKQDKSFDKWRMTIDPSIVSPLAFNGHYKLYEKMMNSAGIEAVSPILKGIKGAAQLRKAAFLLQINNYKTNDTCGLHVHVDISKTTLEEKKNLVKALHRNEAALDKLIPEDRRDSAFARSIKNIDIAALDAAKTTEELVAIVNPHNDRNSKFDFTGLVTQHAPPTVQYRAAGGAGYLGTVSDYAIVLCAFTKQALTNPDVKLKNVIDGLVRENKNPRAAKTPQRNNKP